MNFGQRQPLTTARITALKVRLGLAGLLLLALITTPISVQGQKRKKSSAKSSAPTIDTVAKLREDYINATKDFQVSAQRLLALHEESAKKAEEKLTQSKKLFEQGLISKRELEDSQLAFDSAQAKVNEVKQQIAKADTQIAEVLVEIDTEKQLARARIPRGGMLRTTSFIRFNGAQSWLLSSAGTIQNFFQQSFHKPLPIAVFGQGAIHDRWRLDHRNAMDISLHPDSVEGQALMDFLRRNGIPFSAFRGAIPGTATGPHIHIGRPSHRY